MQGKSGLGLESQRAAVSEYATRIGAALVGQYTEVETGKDRGIPRAAASPGAGHKSCVFCGERHDTLPLFAFAV